MCRSSFGAGIRYPSLNMFNKFKYVIIDGLFPIVFTEAQTHREIGRGYNITSAGFGSVDSEAKVSIWGRSESLNKNSDPKDAEIIQRMIRPL